MPIPRNFQIVVFGRVFHKEFRAIGIEPIRCQRVLEAQLFLDCFHARTDPVAWNSGASGCL